jgi:phosphatidylserine decarboxylase
MASDPRRSADNPIQHITQLVTAAVPPVNKAGIPFIAGGLGLAALGLRSAPLRTLGLAAAGFSAFFFREPKREAPTDQNLIVAPADGEVCLIDEAAPPVELDHPDGISTTRTRISIFLSLLDVHVQRSPISGEVLQVVHTPGAFLTADIPEASQDNERTAMALRLANGEDLVVVQIAGKLARRIICNAQPGDQLSTGETYGLIRFGSRVDIYLPPSATPKAWVGQRTIGGQTVIGTLE